jgi:hypothetical protein
MHGVVFVVAVAPMVCCAVLAQVSRCSQLEEARLTNELAACLPVNPARDDLESALSHLASGQAAAFQALRGAVEACLAVSGGTELKGLLTVVDRSAQQYLVKLQATTGLLLNRWVSAMYTCNLLPGCCIFASSCLCAVDAGPLPRYQATNERAAGVSLPTLTPHPHALMPLPSCAPPGCVRAPPYCPAPAPLPTTA